jgi:hypothetical protein
MKKIVEKIVSLPKWYSYSVMFIYSVLVAEYMSEINIFFLKQGIEVTRIVWALMQLSYVATILASIATWIILSLLFHLSALLLNGEQTFGKFLLATAFPYIIPAVCMFIAILMMDGVDVENGEHVLETLMQSNRFQTITWIVNGSFVPFYIIVAFIIHYLYEINWGRSFLSVVIPIASIWGVTELFSLV